jgi:hypothetical protein
MPPAAAATVKSLNDAGAVVRLQYGNLEHVLLIAARFR